MNVLVCDDDVDVLNYLGGELDDLGCSVKLVQSGYEALKAIREGSYDVVITDYRMHNGDGGMLSNYCSEKAIACIVVTGYDRDSVTPYVPTATAILGKIELIESLHRIDRDNGALRLFDVLNSVKIGNAIKNAAA